ncbi:hypothetical protein AMATHDRAFT_61133 [Amanita thiersii Skay4041]|uniref:Uncharacterized protein n=1 Tax=Amanita thiersii Skay4041 TaxID=703135 RepID=A0A2A9NQ95_9AGAR|nr:hypothetical protein AMATHDRAFT_61133 [Amanita thiersii Skay4041]
MSNQPDRRGPDDAVYHFPPPSEHQHDNCFYLCHQTCAWPLSQLGRQALSMVQQTIPDCTL